MINGQVINRIERDHIDGARDAPEAVAEFNDGSVGITHGKTGGAHRT